jgi:uncharacterized protein (TIGR03067 family)
VRNLLGLTVIAAGLLALAGAAGADDPTKADDQKAIQGTWKVQSVENAGGGGPPEDAIAKIRFVFENDTLTVDMGERKHTAKFKLSGDKKPKQMDIMPGDGPEAGKAFPGIYELSGDTLKICFCEKPDSARPAEFAAKGEKVTLIVLKREKK